MPAFLNAGAVRVKRDGSRSGCARTRRAPDSGVLRGGAKHLVTGSGAAGPADGAKGGAKHLVTSTPSWDPRSRQTRRCPSGRPHFAVLRSAASWPGRCRRADPPAMRAVFSALFWAYLALGCIPLFVGAVVIWLATLPFDRNGRILHLTRASGPALLLEQPVLAPRVEGREHLPWRAGPSWSRTTPRSPTSWCSSVSGGRSSGCRRQSNFRIPFIGWNMRLNRYVPLVRGTRKASPPWCAPARPGSPRASRSSSSRGDPLSRRRGQGLQGRGLPDGHRAAGATHPHHPQRNRGRAPEARLGDPGTARCRVRVLPPWIRALSRVISRLPGTRPGADRGGEGPSRRGGAPRRAD
jgi:hypothetical protein